MFTDPTHPIATLQTSSEAVSVTSRKEGNTTAVPSAATSSKRCLLMRSESAPTMGARKPRSRLSHR